MWENKGWIGEQVLWFVRGEWRDDFVGLHAYIDFVCSDVDFSVMTNPFPSSFLSFVQMAFVLLRLWFCLGCYGLKIKILMKVNMLLVLLDFV